ncbi:hypothetical protein W04_1774 [Pseudoalteromonas sp. SW0106-04]|nr:hypothetical protein W04_1774 [Pseudoalteromonas sp. SW0106-04]
MLAQVRKCAPSNKRTAFYAAITQLGQLSSVVGKILSFFPLM